MTANPGGGDYRPEAITPKCGCPTNVAGDIRCHKCLEYVNKRCWNCRTPRGEGRCPNPIPSVGAAQDAPDATETPDDRLRESIGRPDARETGTDGITNLEGELAQLRAEVERLTHLLGSHTDGHRCTCTLVKDAVYHGDNMAPAEWDQNPWCPTHPDVGMIHERLFNLAEDWQGAADADDTHPREARTMAVLAKELHAVLRGDPLTLDGPATSAPSPPPASTGDTGIRAGSAPSDSPSEAQSDGSAS